MGDNLMGMSTTDHLDVEYKNQYKNWEQFTLEKQKEVKVDAVKAKIGRGVHFLDRKNDPSKHDAIMSIKGRNESPHGEKNPHNQRKDTRHGTENSNNKAKIADYRASQNHGIILNRKNGNGTIELKILKNGKPLLKNQQSPP